VISVGKNNRFGHPTTEVLERLKNIGAEIKRTDEDGEVVVF
jgi:competence protein ComEC